MLEIFLRVLTKSDRPTRPPFILNHSAGGLKLHRLILTFLSASMIAFWCDISRVQTNYTKIFFAQIFRAFMLL